MPQRKVEKKFFQGRVNRSLQNIKSLINRSFAVVEFQEIQKNIAGGAE